MRIAGVEMTRPTTKSVDAPDVSSRYVLSGDGNLRPKNGPYGQSPAEA
jgi:hypothetical protein